MFLEYEELVSVSQLSLLDALTDNSRDMVAQIIEENMALFTSYLGERYDCAKLFRAEGTARNQMVLRYLKACVLYDVHVRWGQEIGYSVEERYKEAITWLSEVNKGKLSPYGLPPVTIEGAAYDVYDNRIVSGGDAKYNSDF